MKTELEKPESVLFGISADEIDYWWDQVEPLIHKPLWRTGAIREYESDDILRFIKTRDMQCWIAHDGAEILAVGVTEIVQYPRRNVLAIVTVGAKNGSIDAWIDHLDTLKAFAERHDCGVIRAWGRKGWAKKLKPDAVRIEFDIEVTT